MTISKYDVSKRISEIELETRLNNWEMKTLDGTFARFGRNLRGANEAQMRSWLVDFQQDRCKEKHGSHTYSAEEYGLHPDEVRERFRNYNEKCSLITAA